MGERASKPRPSGRARSELAVSPFQIKILQLPMTTRSSEAPPGESGAATQAGALLAELEREAERARELIQEVERLVRVNQLRREDYSFELIEQAERTVKQQLLLARNATVTAREAASEEERRSAEAILENAGTLIRRAALFVQVQVFALDGMLERGTPGPTRP